MGNFCDGAPGYDHGAQSVGSGPWFDLGFWFQSGFEDTPDFSMALNRKLVTLLASLATLLVAAIFSVPNGVKEPEAVTVMRVVDGDTVKLSDGRTLRYIGIDTPETVDPRRPVGCFGNEASAKNRELVEGKPIRLEKDVSETDKYGRLLRYVYAGDLFVNEYLVRNGFARASTYPPDVKYQDLFRDAEREARREKRGLWADGACGE